MAHPEKLHTSEVLFKFLRDGTTDPAPADPTAINVNGSVVPKFFDLVAVNDLYLQAGNMLLMHPNQGPTLFGGLPALTNGLLVNVLDENLDVALDLVDTINIKKNADWTYLTGVNHEPIQGQAIEAFSANFVLSGGGGIAAIYLPVNYRFRVTVQDDLSAIDEMRIVLKGQT